MTPDEWALLKDAFAELIELADHERASRLAAMQPRHAAALRRLLSADAEAASRLGAFETEPEPVSDPLGLVGRSVAQFRVLHVLGSGGMGVAYAAEDTRLGRSVALKFLLPHVASDPDSRHRFLHEARAASALDHPNVCTLLEIGDSPSGPFLAMPAYPGETLKSKLERGPLPIDEAVGIARQILSGLGAAHDAGITHRDLKPANVLVTPDGSVRILDFGLARIGDLRLSVPGVRAGTVAYMSPEQVADDEVDARSDLWAVGVVLFEMLTGRRPSVGATTCRRSTRFCTSRRRRWPISARTCRRSSLR